MGVDKDTDARRRNWRAIEIKSAVQLAPSRQFGIEAGATEEVERELCLGEEAVP